MLEKKNQIIERLKNLGTSNCIELLSSIEFMDLQKYYLDIGLEKDMAITDLVENIEDIYVKGNIMQVTYNPEGAVVSLYIHNEEEPNIVNMLNMVSTVYIPRKDWHVLDLMMPGDGVKVNLGMDYKNTIPRFIIKNITLLDEMVFPWYVCPHCGTIYTICTATGEDECYLCSNADTRIKLIKFTNTKDMYDTIDSLQQ